MLVAEPCEHAAFPVHVEPIASMLAPAFLAADGGIGHAGDARHGIEAGAGVQGFSIEQQALVMPNRLSSGDGGMAQRIIAT